MALADYYLCDSCGHKVFYDADVYERYTEGCEENDSCGSIMALCKECVKTKTIAILWGHGVHVYKDGNQWCAVMSDFVNLQESSAGFGPTPQEAVQALQQTLGHGDS